MKWKIILIRTIVNGLAIALVAFFMPGISLAEPSLVNFLILGVVFGLLNAFVKPIIQFLTISLLFITFGLILVVVNAVILLLLDWLMPQQFLTVQSVWAALLGGLLIGLLTSFLEELLGLTRPIVDKTEPARPKAAVPAVEQPRFDNLVAEMKAIKKEVKSDETQQAG
jgi:putative membrane protein